MDKKQLNEYVEELIEKLNSEGLEIKDKKSIASSLYIHYLKESKKSK